MEDADRWLQRNEDELDVLSWSKTDFSFTYVVPVRINATFNVILICSFSF